MTSPYENRPQRSFWRTGVADSRWATTQIYRKRFSLGPDTRIATAGSCFAQHIAKGLRQNGYNVLDAEPPPRGLTESSAREFGYRLYSARYGNIYTARQLLQLTSEALGQSEPDGIIWRKGDRYVDGLRPNIEPSGFDSPDELMLHRKAHLRAVRKVLEADVFIFTFGLTEAWEHAPSGTVFPVAPGTKAGGEFNPAIHVFRNFDFLETYNDFSAFRDLVRAVNPNIRFLLTVSPVPLVATATDQHVLPATIYSKSVLRAVAGKLREVHEDIDYFPSYEIIGTPFTGAGFYSDDLREVTAEGVETVMRIFFAEHGTIELADQQKAAVPRPLKPAKSKEEVVCEEILLEAFAR